jgi:undecaprenyl diphosphate synthase
VAQGSVPVHLGLILDGNRRWARAQGMPQLEGHRQGYQNLHDVALAAFDRGVKYVSAYVFSTENWNRTKEEVDYLMNLFVWVATKEIDKYVHEGLKVVFMGSRERLSKRVLKGIESAESKTAHNTRGVVVLCLNYGGHTELAEGVARLVRDGVPAEEVTVHKLAEYLYQPEVPPVDLIIRTSGEQRLSNFMLWRSAYSELYFVEKPWPAFTVADLDEALEDYASRNRRFGGDAK